MSAHLSEAERERMLAAFLWDGNDSDQYMTCTRTWGVADDILAARAAAAVAAERDRWDTEHAARTSEHIDLHAVKQIIDVTGCDGERGVAAWHALQPLIGHIEREAMVNARAAEREAHRATIQAVRDLHPKIENPRHGCCAPPKLCDGHPPECGGIDHGINRPNWPCATLRALIAEARS